MTQLARFARLFVLAVVPALGALAAGGNKVTVAAVVAVVVPTAEVVWRGLYPTVPAAQAPTPPVNPSTPAKPL